MTKQRSRFCTGALIVMSAVAGLSVAMSTPAHAETVDLICNLNDWYMHVYVDTDRQSVVDTIDDKHYGPFVASISDTLIRWTETDSNVDWEHQYMIDRAAGTMREIQIYRGAQHGELRWRCRRATQKF